MQPDPSTAAALLDALTRGDASCLEPLPAPGSGRTAERFRGLWSLASRSPSIGRLAEAHHDAIAIIAEAGASAAVDDLHAVWAAGGPDPLRLVRDAGVWHLRGSKHWCSGATSARQALVTAESDELGPVLVSVALDRPGVVAGPASWTSPAFVPVDTRSVSFDTEVDERDVIGRDDWYLRRPGFWFGAVGVAACWAGCIDGVVERLLPHWRSDPHALAHLGAIDAVRWNLRTAIDATANEIDDPTTDVHRLALRVRHLVDASTSELLDRIGRALGPAPLAHMPDVHLHLAEADLYRRQCHAERDLEVLGRLSGDSDR